MFGDEQHDGWPKRTERGQQVESFCRGEQPFARLKPLSNLSVVMPASSGHPYNPRMRVEASRAKPLPFFLLDRRMRGR